MMPIPQRILVIDDDADLRELIHGTAGKLAIACTVTGDSASFLLQCTPAVTLILLDLMMPEIDGIELLRLLAQRQCKAGIVLISGVGKRIIETAEELARSLG